MWDLFLYLHVDIVKCYYRGVICFETAWHITKPIRFVINRWKFYGDEAQQDIIGEQTIRGHF